MDLNHHRVIINLPLEKQAHNHKIITKITLINHMKAHNNNHQDSHTKIQMDSLILRVIITNQYKALLIQIIMGKEINQRVKIIKVLGLQINQNKEKTLINKETIIPKEIMDLDLHKMPNNQTVTNN